MEPANKPPVTNGKRRGKEKTELDFLPDADAIERTPLPRFVRLTLHVLVFALITFIVWASLSQVEQVVTAHGRLVNPMQNIVVQPLETSIILKIDVRAGQVVKKGQIMAQLDPTFTQADEAQLRNRLRSLDTQAASLRGDLSGKPGAMAGRTGAVSDADDLVQSQLSEERRANYEAQKTKIEQNIARLRASIETNRRDQAMLAQRVKSLSEIEAMQERLVAENFGAKMQLLEARDRRLEVERSLIMGGNRDIELASELAAAQSEQAAFNKGWRQKMLEDLLSATRDRDGINEQLAKADKRARMVNVVAPADGVVLDIGKLSAGSIVREAETMFTIVPMGSSMRAEVQIDSLDVGQIKVGDPVHLKLDAFSYQKHGMLEGKVTSISQDSFKREQAPQGGGTDAYYLSIVEYGDSKLRKVKEEPRLLPGMTLSAEVVVGKRSVMSYLLWPLTKAVSEAIREP